MICKKHKDEVSNMGIRSLEGEMEGRRGPREGIKEEVQGVH